MSYKEAWELLPFVDERGHSRISSLPRLSFCPPVIDTVGTKTVKSKLSVIGCISERFAVDRNPVGTAVEPNASPDVRAIARAQADTV